MAGTHSNRQPRPPQGTTRVIESHTSAFPHHLAPCAGPTQLPTYVDINKNSGAIVEMEEVRLG
jgi:hypothetical protein